MVYEPVDKIAPDGSPNLNYYREKAGANTKIMVMVKAFAYGSGSAEQLPLPFATLVTSAPDSARLQMRSESN